MLLLGTILVLFLLGNMFAIDFYFGEMCFLDEKFFAISGLFSNKWIFHSLFLHLLRSSFNFSVLICEHSNYMNLFSNIKPCFHSWHKPHTVMMYYTLYVLLVSGCFLHVCSWIRPVYNFLTHSWASFGVKVMLSLI